MNNEKQDVQHWSPDDPDLNPHEFDYKLRIRDTYRNSFRSILLAESKEPRQHEFDLEELAANVDRIKYRNSETKEGMFLQASCIVSDGFESGSASHVLVANRSPFQFHDARFVRNISGSSALFGTLFYPLELIGGKAELSAAILNSLDHDGQFALFGRKLLLPADLVSCAFLGIGFNFDTPKKEYVHFVWHVRVPNRPQVHVVPERQKKEHDVLTWTKIAELNSSFSNAPIDRTALEACGLFKNDHNPPNAGIIIRPRFEGAKKNPRYRVFSRDTVMHDLLLLVQQAIHRGELPLVENTLEEDLRNEVDKFLHLVALKNNLRFETRQESREGMGRHSGNSDLIVDLASSAKHEGHYRYLIEFKRSPQSGDAPKARSQLMSYATRNDFYNALYLVRGIQREESTVSLQGMTQFHGDPPMFQMDCAVQPIPPSAEAPLKHVAHAIILGKIPERKGYYILFTQQADGERPRLPGGKLESNEKRLRETPRTALRRELSEELGLQQDSILQLRTIFPKRPGALDGLPSITSIEVSPSSSLQTPYRIYPFLVTLTSKGKEAILEGLQKADHYPFFSPVERWLEGDMGFDTAYARSVVKHITPEEVKELSVPLSKSHVID